MMAEMASLGGRKLGGMARTDGRTSEESWPPHKVGGFPA